MLLNYYKSLLIPIFALFWLIAIELLFTGSHFFIDLFSNPLSNTDTVQSKQIKKQFTGPSETGREHITSFSSAFNSVPISNSTYQNLGLKLWFSSASHSADEHGTDAQFPNSICQHLDNNNCYLLNAATPGITISANIREFKKLAPDWKPDYALLYQMPIDIHKLSEQEDRSAQDTGKKVQHAGRPTASSQILRQLKLRRHYQHLDSYLFSREFIGSTLLLNTPLKPKLSDESRGIFKNRLLDYIKTVQSHGTKPILMTFVSAQSPDDPSQLYWRLKTWALIWNETLSPEGYIETIGEYNQVIRNLAKEHNIALIDTDRAWGIGNRRPYFDDFVHLNINGHQKMIRVVSNELGKILQHDI